MNKSMLIGRFTRDPEVRYTQGDNSIAIARFNLAVDRRFNRNNEENTADFIPCVAFGKTAEFIEKYFTKGKKIAVCGRLQSGSYTNKDGVKVYTLDVIVEEAEFVESKGNGDGGNGGSSYPSNNGGNGSGNGNGNGGGNSGYNNNNNRGNNGGGNNGGGNGNGGGNNGYNNNYGYGSDGFMNIPDGIDEELPFN